jgi:FkbM family methyltransferase
MSARRDVANNPRTNGEYWLLDTLLKNSQPGESCLLDIGANQGEWVSHAIESSERVRRKVTIHAFEPASATFQVLSDRTARWSQVRCHQLALSNRRGQADFFVIDSLAGTNSLHSMPGAAVEKVALDTLDSRVVDLHIGRILMVKVDTEGHDLSVLEGARNLISTAGAEVIQFEYNHSWISNRASLSQVFELIKGSRYKFGKLFGNGIELFSRWHPELDRFFECNCLLLRDDSCVLSHAIATSFTASNSPQPAARSGGVRS